MTRRRRTRMPRAPGAASPHPVSVSESKGLPWIIAGIGMLAVVAALTGLQLWRDRSLPAFPAVALAASPGGADGDYAGADACMQCHASEHSAWSSSTHGNAGGTPREREPLASFDGRPIRFRDGLVLPAGGDGGDLRFTVVRPDRDDVVFDVAAMVGGGHMVGGGTQGYFTRAADGTVRLLPWELTADGVWFCNTGEAASGWQPITEEMRLADCGDWPPRRTLGGHDRLGNCQECHGSGIVSTVDDGGTRTTRWRSLAIDCESCHGPAREHVEAGGGAPPPSLLSLDKEASVQLCLRCHALKDALEPGYMAGRELTRHYSVGLPAVSGEALFADGRTRTFAYQEGHLYSACYLNGGMTCVDCHAPHSQEYRTFQGTALRGRFDDGQCLGCHAAKGVTTTEHTRHVAGSAGSRCVACHMPYLQQPDVGSAIPYARADHTISIPRPALDSLLGVRGACANCHRELSDTELNRVTEQWYGPLKPLAAPVAALIDPSAGKLHELLDRAERHPMATLSLLGRELRLAGAGSKTLDRQTRNSLMRLGGNADPDMAAAALALLHLAHGNDRQVRTRIIHALSAHPSAARVRDRWIALLAWIGDEQAAGDRPDQAIAAYRKALELPPADPGVLRNLGYAQLRVGRTVDAIASFRASAAASPSDPLGHVGLGVALTTAGQQAAATEAYREALRVDPNEPLALFNLANAALRQGRHEEAAAGYRRVLRIDPSMTSAAFNLARAAIAQGHLQEAADALRAGLEFEPDNTAAADMLAELLTLRAQPTAR